MSQGFRPMAGDIQIYFFRFVNTVLLSGLEIEQLWNLIKRLRLTYLIENVKTINTLPCYFSNTEAFVIPTRDDDAHSNLIKMDSIKTELHKIGSSNYKNMI